MMKPYHFMMTSLINSPSAIFIYSQHSVYDLDIIILSIYPKLLSTQIISAILKFKLQFIHRWGSTLI
jgi:hypothetical protein